MPSVESYRRRKQEVERLTCDLIRAQDSIRYAVRYMQALEQALKIANLHERQANIMVNIWHDYVREHYLMRLPEPVVVSAPIEVPACIKPKDVSAYIFREKPEVWKSPLPLECCGKVPSECECLEKSNGPNNLSQELP